MRLYWLVLFVLVSFISNSQEVTYSFNDLKFVNKLPIDENFSIRFTDVPDTIDRIDVRIWNTSSAHRIQRNLKRRHKRNRKCEEWYADGKFNKHSRRCDEDEVINALDNSQIFNHRLTQTHIHGYTDVVRMASTMTHAKIDFATKLVPNNSYFIEIEAGLLQTLTSEQETLLISELERSAEIKDLVGELTRYRAHQNSLDFSFISSVFRPLLISKVSKVLKGLDGTYRIKEPNPSEFQGRLNTGRINAHLANIYIAHNELADVAKELSYMSFEKDFNSIDWSDFTQSSPKYGALVSEFNKGFQKAGKSGNFSQTYGRGIEDNLKKIINNRDDLIPLVVDLTVSEYVWTFSGLNQTYFTEAVENSKRYLFADVGYGYGEEVHHFAHALLSVHLRPVNETIPPRQYSGIDKMLTRCSFILGGTVSENDFSAGNKGIINDRQAVLLGMGLRVVPGVKIHGGSLFYYKIPSPVVAKQNLTNGWFISIGIDFNVQPSFKKAFNKSND